jgi:hypothetical protein
MGLLELRVELLVVCSEQEELLSGQVEEGVKVKEIKLVVVQVLRMVVV